jgi:hypothetical protein
MFPQAKSKSQMTILRHLLETPPSELAFIKEVSDNEIESPGDTESNHLYDPDEE